MHSIAGARASPETPHNVCLRGWIRELRPKQDFRLTSVGWTIKNFGQSESGPVLGGGQLDGYAFKVLDESNGVLDEAGYLE